jgi:hypothetical protein
VNLCLIKANIWNFIYVGFEEEHIGNGTKFNCKIEFSFNLKPIVIKVFEIFVTQDQQQQKQQQQHGNDLNSYFYIDHKENEINLDLLFNFDSGQLILSEGISFTIDHLVLIMQIIDDIINTQYEWTFLNGYLHASIIQNIINNYKAKCEEIKVCIRYFNLPFYKLKFPFCFY